MIRLLDVSYMSSAGLFRNMDFHLTAGGAAVVLGTRNSGKSDFVNVCLGNSPVIEGTVQILGKNTVDYTPDDRAGLTNQIGFVTQHITLLDNLTVARNIGLPLSYHQGLSDEETQRTVQPVLEEFGIAGIGNRFPHQISSDDAKMAMIARATVLNPRLVVLDEPTAGDLDPEGFIQVMNAIKLFRKKGTALLILTCSPSMAAIEGADFYYLVGRRLIPHTGAKDAADLTMMEFFTQIRKYTERQKSEISGFYHLLLDEKKET